MLPFLEGQRQHTAPGLLSVAGRSTIITRKHLGRKVGAVQTNAPEDAEMMSGEVRLRTAPNTTWQAKFSARLLRIGCDDCKEHGRLAPPNG